MTENPIIVNSVQSDARTPEEYQELVQKIMSMFGNSPMTKLMLKVNSDPNSHDAASRITVLCDDSVRLYQSSFKHLTDLDEIRDWMYEKIKQTNTLIIAMTDLCKKITEYEDAVSVFANLFSVSNELKKPIHNTDSNWWNTVKQYQFKRILNLMDSLVSHFENAEDVMRLILENLLLTGDSIENLQLEGMLEILFILSPRIKISESATQFIKQLSEFASEYKQFHSYHIGKILDIMEKLIRKVNGSKHIISVIQNMLNIIIKSDQFQPGACFERYHLQGILLILKPLIERIKNSDDVTPIKQSLIIIKEWFPDQFGESEIIRLLDEIIRLFPYNENTRRVL